MPNLAVTLDSDIRDPMWTLESMPPSPLTEKERIRKDAGTQPDVDETIA